MAGMKSFPFAQRLIKVWDGAFVDRSSGSDHMSNQILDWQRDPSRLPIAIFPEGKVTTGEGLLGFRSGAFLGDEPVQAVGIRYKMWFTPKGMSTPAWLENQIGDYFWQLWGIPFITVEVTVLEPLDLKGLTPKEKAGTVELQLANYFGCRAIKKTNKSLFRHPKAA
jgi:1-acyl-sn-glycerol-3-phosphate acyltransferase